MARRSLLLLALLACALGAVACGGGDDDVDVQQVLRQTFGENKDLKSGKLDVSVRLDANGLASLQGPVSARLAGPWATTAPDELPRFDFEADLNAGGQSIRAGATSTGEKAFISFQGQAYELSGQLYEEFKKGYAEQAKEGGEEEGVTFRALGVDPQRWLRDTEYVDKAEVGGVETLHLRAGVDVPRLLEDVNRVLTRAEQIPGQGQRARELTEAERRQISEAIEDARLELWTGEEDKILRRLNVRLRFEVPEENRQQANGLTSGTIRFDLVLGSINEDQKIAGPEGARPLEELIGAVGGGGQAPPSDSGGGQAPPSDSGGGQAATPYEQCVQDAGADISKLQECAGLEGG